MSQHGLQAFASVLAIAQQVRITLFMGDAQDIMLGRLLERMNDSVTAEFCEITSETPLVRVSHDGLTTDESADLIRSMLGLTSGTKSG